MSESGSATGVRKAFLHCSCCRFAWPTRTEFLADPHVYVVGYQVNYGELAAGFFLFNHSCGTTLALTVGTFRDLYDGPMFEKRLTDTDDCPSYCLRPGELGLCPAECECAYVRQILQIVRRWPKHGGRDAS